MIGGATCAGDCGHIHLLRGFRCAIYVPFGQLATDVQPRRTGARLDLSMVGYETPRRASWVGASSPSSHNGWRLADPSTAFWGKSATACASDPEPIDCLVDLTSPNCPAR